MNPGIADKVMWGMALTASVLVFVSDSVGKSIACAICALFCFGCVMRSYLREGASHVDEKQLFEIPDSVEMGDAETAIRELEELRELTDKWLYALAERVRGACFHGHPELAHALLDYFEVSVDALPYWAPLAPNSAEEEAELFHLDYLKSFITERRKREGREQA